MLSRFFLVATVFFSSVVYAEDSLGRLGRACLKATEKAAVSSEACQTLKEALSAYPLEDEQLAFGLEVRGQTLKLMGQFDEAHALFLRALSLRERLQGYDHPYVGRTLIHLGELDGAVGRPERGEERIQKGLALLKEAGSPFLEEYAFGLSRLGGVFTLNRKWNHAEAAFKEALKLHRQRLGNEHETIANELVNLARLKQVREHYQEAEPLYRQALMMYKKCQGESSEEVARVYYDLGRLYQDQDRWIEAEPALKTALSLQERLGTALPLSTLNATRQSLAALFESTGRKEQAKILRAQIKTQSNRP